MDILNISYNDKNEDVNNNGYDLNSPPILFASLLVKNKFVELFGGHVIKGEITEDEAAKVTSKEFRTKCRKLFLNVSEKFSCHELKYFKKVKILPFNMFFNAYVTGLSFPPNLEAIDNLCFWNKNNYPELLSDNLSMTFPDTCKVLGTACFLNTYIKELHGLRVTKCGILLNMPNLEVLDFPNLEEITRSASTYFLISNTILELNLPKLKKLQGIFPLLGKCPNLTTINTPNWENGIYLFDLANKPFTPINLPKLKTVNLGWLRDDIYSIAIMGNSELQINIKGLEGNYSLYTIFSKYTGRNLYWNGYKLTINNTNSLILNSLLKEYPHTLSTFNYFGGKDDLHKLFDLTIENVDRLNINPKKLYNSYCYMAGFKTITLESGEEIPPICFSMMPYLEKFVCSPKLKKISYFGMSDNPKLKKLELPDTLEIIDDFAFAITIWFRNGGFFTNGNEGLLELMIPKNVKYIGGAFVLNHNIINLKLDPENPYFVMDNGIIYSKDYKRVVYVPNLETINIDPRVEEVGNYCFYGLSKVKKVIGLENVTKVGAGAFLNSNIEELHFNKKLNKINHVHYTHFEESNVSKKYMSAFYKFKGKLIFAGKELTLEEKNKINQDNIELKEIGSQGSLYM